MTNEQQILLEAPFKASEIRWRLRNSTDNGGYAVPYLDSRAIQNRLDSVLGKENWQCSFSVISTGNAKEPIVNTCTISIYYVERSEWVSKSDGAGWSDIEPVKGGLSDALKRAASMWGCGRFMYQLTDIWVDIEKRGKSVVVAQSSYPKLNDYYEKAIKNIIAEQPPVNPLPASIPMQSNSKKQVSDLYLVKSISPTGKGENLAVQLKNASGNILDVYAAGPVNFKVGQKLKDVRYSEKSGPKGAYRILDHHEIAA